MELYLMLLCRGMEWDTQTMYAQQDFEHMKKVLNQKMEFVVG